jgi:dTDP-L-rhamnose 4-epimerase
MTAPATHVLVTGGAGFIGSHIVDDLLASGVAVTILDNLDSAAHAVRPDYINPRANFIKGDVRRIEDWQRALVGVDAVCHQAGKVGLGVDFGDVAGYVDHNDSGTAVGLLAMHNMGFSGRIVLASSMVVYGEGRYVCSVHGVVTPGPRNEAELLRANFEPPCPNCGMSLQPEAIPETAPLDPRNVYAATKLHQEHLLRAYEREHPTPVTALRYHNVYGPRMPRDTPYAGVASIFRSALEAGLAPQVNEDGNQLRNFVHVRDVAAANVVSLLRAEPCSGSFNVASPTQRSVGDMARSLAMAFGASPGDTLWPVVNGRYRLGDVRHVFASTTHAAERLGFRASIGFDEGMLEFATAPLRASVKQA